MKSTKLDFKIQKKHMVQQQLVPRGISDKRVLDIFLKIDRHKFVPDKIKDVSYDDCPLPIGYDQTISQPYIVALMTQALELNGGEHVLEIGTGSGYQTAILAELAKEVYSIERIEDLAEGARSVFSELGYKNIQVKTADGSLGWKEFSPYDAIIVAAASEYVPPPLLEQLNTGGQLIIPLGNTFSQTLMRFTRNKADIKKEAICSCVFVPLIGKYGLICK